MKRKGFLLLALLCGLIAAASTYVYLRNTGQKAVIETKPLVMAKTNISARSVIDASQLVTKDVPKQGYPQGGAAKIEDVQGAVALVNLTPGDTVLSSELERANGIPPTPAVNKNGQLSPSGNQPPAVPNISVPEGKRALAIPVSLISSVAYSVKPGDHVDVLTTIDVPVTGQGQLGQTNGQGGSNQAGQISGTASTVTVTSLVAQDVLVLSTGDGKAEAKAFVLAVSVPQAMAVTLASEKGSLRLLLRNPANQDIREDSSIDSKVFFDSKYLSNLSKG